MGGLSILNYSIQIINNYNKLLESIIYYNDYFFPSLMNMTKNLEKYAKKIYNNAINFEIINEKNETLGIISIYANDRINNTAFITLIAVNKNHSNCGIGSLLIEYAEKYCKDKGMGKIRLEVQKTNTNAIKFYKKHKYYIEEENDTTYYMIKKL